MVNRFCEATGFCPPFVSLPDGTGFVIPPSKRGICQTCKFLPKNTLFRRPAMVFLTPKRPPLTPQNPTRFGCWFRHLCQTPKTHPPNLQCPRQTQLGL